MTGDAATLLAFIHHCLAPVVTIMAWTHTGEKDVVTVRLVLTKQKLYSLLRSQDDRSGSVKSEVKPVLRVWVEGLAHLPQFSCPLGR